MRHKYAAITGTKASPSPHYIDNQSAIDIGTNPVQLNRNRHMHARYFYYAEKHAENETKLIKIPSVDNIADLLVTFKDVTTFTRLTAIIKGHKMPNFPAQSS